MSLSSLLSLISNHYHLLHRGSHYGCCCCHADGGSKGEMGVMMVMGDLMQGVEIFFLFQICPCINSLSGYHLYAEFSALRRVHLRVISLDFGEGSWFHEAHGQKRRYVIRRQDVRNDDESLLRASLELSQRKVGVKMPTDVPGG